MAETRRAVCCACHQQCGVLVEIDAGRVAAIRGDKEHPFSAGFVCVKGQHAHDQHYHADRVHRPRKRIGARGAGRWQEIPWEQALDEIAARIGELAGRHGQETLAHAFGTFHGADFGIGQRFLNLFGSPNTVGQDKICYGPGALGETLTYGFGPSFFTFPIPGLTRCMVLWGLRPAASSPLLWRQILRVQKAGAKLVVIDPERVKEARGADLHVQPLPGTDAALALGLTRVLIDNGWHDEAFVRTHTVGFEELRERLAQYAPARVAELTGVPASDIVRIAELLGNNRPAIIHAGNGLCQSGHGAVQTGRALACLVAVSGNLGVQGGHRLNGPPLNLLANGDAVAESALTPQQAARRLGADRYALLGKGYAEMDQALAGAWHGHHGVMNWLASAHAPTLWRAILERKPYAVTALILQHHNPVGASANAALAEAALASPNLELLVAQDLFVTPASRLADYLLPAAHWLEKPFYSMGLGYMGIAGDYVEAKPAVLPTEHEHHGDYDLWRDLGRRLGQAEHWPDTADRFWNTCLAPAGLDFGTVSAAVGPIMGPPARGPDRPRGHGSPKDWGTPSGKVELRSSLLAGWGLDPLPAFDPPALLADSATEFPLRLTTGGRRIEGFHQDAQRMPWFRRKYPEPEFCLHPETAARAGIGDGDWAWIETPTGRVRQRARCTDGLRPGVVQSDRWWYPERGPDGDDPFGWRGTNINVCTGDAAEQCDPVLGTWMLRGVPCRIVAEKD
jgi:anaerobic selenocysteine-containing dehydrogenase